MSLIEKENLGSSTVRAKRKPPVRRSLGAGAAMQPFKMPDVRRPTFPDRVIDIRDHGALDDDHSDSGQAIASAIEACHTAGGGRVLIPAGRWFTSQIHLRSHVDLHLEEGAIVRFSSNPQDYLPPVFVRWGGIECYNYSPLIYARGCQNIAVTGKGALLGQGMPWWPWEKREPVSLARLHEMVTKQMPLEDRRCGDEDWPMRPQMIMPINCTGVLLEDFTVAESGPSWTVHVAYCRNVIIRRLRINAPDGPANDGIIIDSSRNVIIEDCDLHTKEDCVALKSGINEEGWRVGRPTENVLIRRIRATSGAGGFTIGSDIAGGVRNVMVQDCDFENLGAGVRFKAARGCGGVVENIFIQDIRMGRIPGDAIQMTTEFGNTVKIEGKAPLLRNIHIRNVTCSSAKMAVRMIGQSDTPIRDVTLENLSIEAEEGLYCSGTNGINLMNVKITPRTGPVMSLKDTQKVLVHGLHGIQSDHVFMDLRGRQTRGIRLDGQMSQNFRPTILLGIDVPRDAIIQD